MLTAYDAAHPGAATWILKEAEANAQHVRDMERRAIRDQSRDNLLHRLLPFLLVFVLIVASVILAVFANKVLGGVAFFGTLASVVIAYLKGSQPQPSNPARKPK